METVEYKRLARAFSIRRKNTTVTYDASDDTILLDNPETTLLTAAVQNRIPHMQECGGNGKCTTCRVRILDGLDNVVEPGPLERTLARNRCWDPSIRLACQTRVRGPVKVERLIKTFSEVTRLQEELVRSGTGKEKQLAILFCDIRDFTPLVEKQLAYDIVHILNRLFAVLGEPILANNGFIYQYVGDEIVALFGLDEPDHAQPNRAALRAALGMEAALRDLNEDLDREFGLQIRIGIGIHYGPVVAGQVGHPSRQQFGIIGDAANVASRIQAANKELGTTILASEEVVRRLPAGSLPETPPLTVRLKGKEQPARLYEITGFAQPDPLLLVQRTMGHLFRDDLAFAKSFYRKLFAEAPELRAHFKNDPGRQNLLMTHMMKGAVYALSRPDNLALGLRELGKRHVQYGVERAHYELVGRIVLEVIADQLGHRYTREVGAAWKMVIDTVFKYMQEGID